MVISRRYDIISFVIQKLVDDAIFKVENFPKPGVLFYDITGILINPKVFCTLIDYYKERYKDSKVHAIVAVDSRGFLFASPVAYALGLPLILVRKTGKLPRPTISQSYELEYGEATVEVNPDDIPKGPVVLFDDLIATGGTAKASCMLLESQGAQIYEIAAIIALDFLPYKDVLSQYALHSIVSYSSEKVGE